MSRTDVPDRLVNDGRPDYQRGWMIKNGRTKSVAVSTERIAYMLVTFTRKDVDRLYDLLGEDTCKAALAAHTVSTPVGSKPGDETTNN